MPERLAQRTEELNRRGQAALAEEYAQLWEILCGGLEQCAQILGGAPMELDEFSKLFALVLSQYDVGSIPVSLDRVTAGEAARMGGRAVKAARRRFRSVRCGRAGGRGGFLSGCLASRFVRNGGADAVRET